MIIDSSLNNKKESDILKCIINEIISSTSKVRHINSLRTSRSGFPVKRPSFWLKFGKESPLINYEGNINREEVLKFILSECDKNLRFDINTNIAA